MLEDSFLRLLPCYTDRDSYKTIQNDYFETINNQRNIEKKTIITQINKVLGM